MVTAQGETPKKLNKQLQLSGFSEGKNKCKFFSLPRAILCALLSLSGSTVQTLVFLHVLKSLLWNRTETQIKVRVQEPGNTGDEGSSQKACRNWFQVGPICLKAEEVQELCRQWRQSHGAPAGSRLASSPQPAGLHPGQRENTNTAHPCLWRLP